MRDILDLGANFNQHNQLCRTFPRDQACGVGELSIRSGLLSSCSVRLKLQADGGCHAVGQIWFP